MRCRLRMSLLLLLALPMSAAQAQGKTTWYRCTDAKGVVSLQNGTACPPGSKQEKRQVESVQSLPPPPAAGVPLNLPSQQQPAHPTSGMPAGPAAAGATAAYPTPLPLPAANTVLAQRLPPPPLFECRTYNNDSYLDDDPMPKQRCAPMDTVGIDGSAERGAGAACSMQTDQCQRVPDGQACDAWRKWLNQAQASMTFARAEFRDKTKADYERLARVVAETSCNTDQ